MPPGHCPLGRSQGSPMSLSTLSAAAGPPSCWQPAPMNFSTSRGLCSLPALQRLSPPCRVACSIQFLSLLNTTPKDAPKA